MTILSVLSVYDTVANMYGSPFYAISPAVAIRQFQAELARDGDGPMQTHPQDFKLFDLGHFDDSSGKIQMYDQPIFLYQGSAKTL